MLRGIYSAANAMRYRAHEVEVTANNIANVTTDGFKSDRLGLRSFGDILASRVGDQTQDNSGPIPIGNATLGGCTAEAPFTDFSQGPPRVTGNSLDLYLSGPGFFAVQTDNGTRYTRTGSFSLSGTGEIVTPSGERLLGTDGNPVRIVSPDPILINSNGEISQNGVPVGRIQIAEFSDLSALEKEGYTLFRPIDPDVTTPSPASATSVEQGTIEGSNVNAVDCLIQLIVSQRAYEAAAKAVDMFNQSMTHVSGELGRIS
jgi:flagellar basal-body rod protein FlgF